MKGFRQSAADEFEIRRGIAPEHVDVAAVHLLQAFSTKLLVALGDSKRAADYLKRAIDPANALCAIGPGDALYGVVGLKTTKTSFLSGGFDQLRAVYGTPGAIWRGLLLSVLEHRCPPGAQHIECIVVTESARGLGVGTALLDAVIANARQDGAAAVSLEVVNTNANARRLYERIGFVPIKTVSLGPLRRVFGFDAATTMELKLDS